MIRPTAVAGTFYPSDPTVLEEAVDRYVAGGQPAEPPPVAIIAPHAGYAYSGPTAGVAYATIAGWRGQVERVVLAGPAHRAYLPGVGTSSADAWDSPLGPVPVDRACCDALVARGLATVADGPHAPEHSLEVHLPFLQRSLDGFDLVPLVVGDASDDEVAAAYDAALDGRRSALVVSSDLSHYHDDATAKALDARTAAAILDGRTVDVGPRDACGAVPIRGLLALAARRGWEPRVLDLRTSGDTAGDRDRVVGYGAFAFTEAAQP